MADSKISQLAAAGALDGSELVEAVQGGVNVQTTTQDIANLAAAGNGHVIEDEGTPLTQRANLNFVGAGVSAADAGGKTVVTIPDGGAGKLDLTDFSTLVDAAPVVFDCASEPEPKGYLETSTSRTLDLQNVRGDNVLNAYSAITLVIKKTTASDIVITLDSGFTNRDAITDASVTTYTLSGTSGSYHKITALVIGQASGALMFWTKISQTSLALTTGSMFVGVSSLAAEKAIGAEFDISGATVILAALGVTGSKIANSTVTFGKILGGVGSGERLLNEDNAGAISDTYAIAAGTITDSTVITNLTTESGWSGETKSVSNTLEGQTYQGTGSTGIKYLYRITTDGTAVRTPVGEGKELTSIQIPPYTEVTGTTQQMAINNAYGSNNGSLVTLTIPVTAAVGDIVEVSGVGAGGWRIAQNASQVIKRIDGAGANTTTTGTGGHIDSGARYDCVKLKCIVANTTWVIQNASGTIAFT